MNFSEEYLYGNFEKSYKEAVKAKADGNLRVAKDKFYQAAEYLEKLAIVSIGEAKAERAARAKRLKAIAEAIVVEDVAAGTFAPKYNPSSSLGQSEQSGAAAKPIDAQGMEQFFTFYTAGELVDGFDGVIGLQAAKDAIREYVINPILYPDAYSYTFLGSKAVLLEGPPGTGKTTFAKAVAKEIEQPFALINVAGLVNCYVGETGKNIDKVFAFLRDYAKLNGCGITVFFDELDEIAKRRGGDDKASETAVPALLRNLDGVRENKAFLILANTNRKDALDSAILERFRKQIYIPLPDSEARENLFVSKLKEVEREFIEQLDLAAAVELSEGLSGRDIAFICDDLKYALSEIKAGIAKDVDIREKLNAMITRRRTEKQL